MSLRHLVLLSFKPETSKHDIASIEQAFCALQEKVDVISRFEWGVDISQEGLSKGFTHAFLLTFDDSAARDMYLLHPAHQAFVNQLKMSLNDVLVVDYQVGAGT